MLCGVGCGCPGWLWWLPGLFVFFSAVQRIIFGNNFCHHPIQFLPGPACGVK
jgi:hypothetical protein